MISDAARKQLAVERLVQKAGGWPWRYDVHVEDHEFCFHLPAGASAQGAGSPMQKLQTLLEPKDIQILTGGYECYCYHSSGPRPKLRTVNKTPEELAMQRVCTYVTFINVTWPWER